MWIQSRGTLAPKLDPDTSVWPIFHSDHATWTQPGHSVILRHPGLYSKVETRPYNTNCHNFHDIEMDLDSTRQKAGNSRDQPEKLYIVKLPKWCLFPKLELWLPRSSELTNLDFPIRFHFAFWHESLPVPPGPPSHPVTIRVEWIYGYWSHMATQIFQPSIWEVLYTH